jgi:hypothetical protein
MVFGVQLGRLAAVVRGMCGVAVGGMRVMGRLMMIAIVVVLCGLAMMVGSLFVVLGSGAMMSGAFVNRHGSLRWELLDQWRYHSGS